MSSDNDSYGDDDHRRRRREQADDEQRPARSSKPLTEEERAEIERERDLRERDEFAARLAERDKVKSKNLDERGSGGKNDAQEIARRREEYERRLALGEEVVDEATGKAALQYGSDGDASSGALDAWAKALKHMQA